MKQKETMIFWQLEELSKMCDAGLNTQETTKEFLQLVKKLEITAAENLAIEQEFVNNQTIIE